MPNKFTNLFQNADISKPDLLCKLNDCRLKFSKQISSWISSKQISLFSPAAFFSIFHSLHHTWCTPMMSGLVRLRSQKSNHEIWNLPVVARSAHSKAISSQSMTTLIKACANKRRNSILEFLFPSWKSMIYECEMLAKNASHSPFYIVGHCRANKRGGKQWNT